jgi:hypothetical protein
MPKSRGWRVAVIVALVVVGFLLGFYRHWFTSWHGWKWEGWSAWVAIGTILLAVVTWRLARTSAQEIRIERERLADAQRPHVFPVTYTQWVDKTERYAQRAFDVVPISNGGPGVALNIRGQLTFASGNPVDFVPTSLGAGQTHDLRLNWPGEDDAAEAQWKDASGELMYHDGAGQTFTSTFVVREQNGRRFLEFGEFR